MIQQKFTRFESEIIDIKQLTKDTKHFKISVPKDFLFIPGQYVSIIKDNTEKSTKLRRPYSIVSTPSQTKENYIELCIKILENGNITPILDKEKTGNKLEILGPLGNFTINKESTQKNIIFISAGVGIAPFKSMISELLANNFKNKITLITGYKNENTILYDKEFKDLEKKHPNFIYKTILSQPINNQDKPGRVQILLEENFDSSADYYICGLKDMISSVQLLLLKKGILGKNIYSEKYD